jgi:hypoxanthine phosphoribosyltransferase
MNNRSATQLEAHVRVLYSAAQIAARVREMGLDIARQLNGTRPLFVGVLKGAVMFQADLARATPIDLDLEFLTLASYGQNLSSSGTPQLITDIQSPIAGRNVVLCEGVVDSGQSVSFLLDTLRSRGAARIQVATLLDKVPCRKIPVPLDHVGWRIGEEFVVGYGLDAAERYRNLPFVGALEEVER